MIMARIVAEGVGVSFPLYHAGARSLKRTLLSRASSRLAMERGDRLVVRALRDVTFEARGGERIGLVGPNGAGKSTLLRTLAGIYAPDAGRLRVEGRVASLLDMSAGMNGFLTGRENARLIGRQRGLSGRDLTRLVEDVEAFSELGAFFDVPVRTYSAGMSVRLGFALATHGEPDILLIDEWISAGDAGFRLKAEERLQGLVRSADIVMLASHDPGAIARWCGRVFRVQDGHVVEETLGRAEGLDGG